jgi:hypothetical protein
MAAPAPKVALDSFFAVPLPLRLPCALVSPAIARLICCHFFVPVAFF